MLKIVVTDPHLMDKEVLAKTGKFLMDLATISKACAPSHRKPPNYPSFRRHRHRSHRITSCRLSLSYPPPILCHPHRRITRLPTPPNQR